MVTTNITFVGWYGKANCGDEAFKDVHKQIFPDCNITWASHASEIPRGKQTFVLGGGDVVLDFYVQHIPENEKFFVYGAGLGGPEQRDFIADMKDRVRGVWLRNADDVDALKHRGVDAYYTPDTVFSLRDAAENRPPVLSRFVDSGRKKLIFFPSYTPIGSAKRRNDLNSALYQEWLQLEIASALDELSKYYDVLLYPMSREANQDDEIYCRSVYSLSKRKEAWTLISEELSPLDVAKLVSEVELVVSTKFHGSVFAMMTGTRCVNIGMTRKTQLLYEQHGLPQLSLEPHTFSVARLMKAVKLAEGSEAAARLKELRAHLPEQANEAAATFRDRVLSRD